MKQLFNKKDNLRLFFVCFLLVPVFNVYSQEIKETEEFKMVEIDSLYREDQFYFGLTYNSLLQGPVDLSQNKISLGIAAGFLRDMPINKNRTMAIASGVGFSYNNYNQNLAISEIGETTAYSIIDSKAAYDKNKFTQLLVEVPLEFRWRTSTYDSHKFWRIYAGVKFSYLLYDKSTFVDAQSESTVTGNRDFNKFLYGVYLSSGYNTLNVYVYYGLNPLFKSAEIDGENIAMKSLNIGLIFYIL
jgi:hypothetical protein